jgi:hypothetical protein
VLAGHAASAARRACLPTPRLPTAALDALAASSTLAELADRLAARDSPYAAAIRQQPAAATPRDLQLAVDRAFARHALRIGRRGGRALRAWAAAAVDEANAWTALAWVGPAERVEAAHLPGGRRLPRAVFLAAAGEPTTAVARLAPCFAGSALGSELAAGRLEPWPLADAALRDRIAEQRRLARRDPASAATLAVFLLALRREVVCLRRGIWRAASRERAGWAA